MGFIVSSVSKVPKEEVVDFPTAKTTRYSCAADCKHALYRVDHGGDPLKVTSEWGGSVYRLGTNMLVHERCLPGQTPAQKILKGVKAAGEGTWAWMRRNPIITFTALAAIAFFSGYAYASSETIQTICFRDRVDNTVAWCADISLQKNLPNAVYGKFVRVNDWVPSSDLSTRTYESVKDGSQFIYNTFLRYFATDPFESTLNWFNGLLH